jgi:cystathionine beta-lyase
MNLENCIISKYNNIFYYNRFGHGKHILLCEKLEKLYGYKACLFPSGMSAISTGLSIMLMSNNWSKTNILYSNELYCDTPRTIKYLSENFINLNQVVINVEDDENIMKIVNDIDKSIPTIFFIESCSNPNAKIFNFDLLKQIKKKIPNIKIIIDNTWLTSIVFNPFSFQEVDMVVISMTKYYGAGNSGIMGAVISRNEMLANKIFDYGRIMGLHVSPIYCKQILKNLENMSERLKKSSNLTLQIAKYLESKDIQVNYPLLDSHSSYNKAIKYFNNGLGPSVLTFKIKKSKKAALKWMRKSNLECSTSFGGSHSKFDQWPISSEGYTTCRLSIGYNDSYESLIKEFENMFSYI